MDNENGSIQWRKSPEDGDGDGVSEESGIEIAGHGDDILLRQGDDPTTVVTTSREKLRAFLLGVKAGEFDDLV
ncbi:DUF397 domain-containing protein [Streptomyces sp. NPDC046887]|uniref:DUF397 domain-containing protein n=1 Tax=Streptomyces sp. NPDC046887 TaxID=3155472 RepID=UPI0033E08B4A